MAGLRFTAIVAFLLVLSSVEGSVFRSSTDEDELKEELKVVLQRLQEEELEIKELKQELRAESYLLERTAVDFHPRASTPRTCLEIYTYDKTSPSGNYTIDPDGSGTSFTVFCEMSNQTTIISHNLINMIQIKDNCSTDGCHGKEVKYEGATMEQMKALAKVSGSCRQYFKLLCKGIPFEFSGKQYALWTDSNGVNQSYWAGNGPKHTCQCGIASSSCYEDTVKCNCDSLLPEFLIDEGYITNKDHLPVQNLFFGHLHVPNSAAVHMLGKFECYGRPTLSSEPTSCADLWNADHTLNGMYMIKAGNTIRTVFCDFSKLPGEPGQQMDVGEVDVKSKPAYFYVTRKTSVSGPDDLDMFDPPVINIGGYMDNNIGTFTAPVDGIYFFTFSAQGSFEVTLRAGGENTQTTSDLSATYNLKTNDEVKIFVETGAVNPPIRFSGMLVQEKLG